MIVKMSKYAFMVFHREYDSFLLNLRDLGVVHIQPTKSIAGNDKLQSLLATRKQIASQLRFLSDVNRKGKVTKLDEGHLPDDATGKKLIQKMEALQEKKAQLLAAKQSTDKDLNYMEQWGDFNYKDVNRLKEAGYEMNFFTCPTAKYEPKWGEKYHATLVNNFQSISYFVTITKIGTPIEIDAERPKMPDMGLNDLRALSAKTDENIKAVDAEMAKMAVSEYNSLLMFDKKLQDDFNMENAHEQVSKQADDRLMVLEGWIPEADAPAMEKDLEAKDYFFEKLNIKEQDKVPIKLRNNSFAKLYEPITKMFSLPNYSEIDPTPLFAPFFMLFFGLCFGDAGYGLLVVGVCTYLKMKKSTKEDIKPVLTLFQYLGGAAVVVGACTGSFLGITLATVPMFAGVKDWFVSSDNMMTFSILIGLVQIIFGKAVAAYKIKMQKGTKYCIAPFAWVFGIVACGLAFGLPYLNVQLPGTFKTVCIWIAYACGAVIFFYNTPGKNIFLNFGTGLWNTYGIASGLLGDTLSYIRLFAIGLTGSILGGVFNSLAISMTDGMNIFARLLCMLPILLFGHAINIGLCTISSLVHPLRLIFVEYYKNAEFEGGGKAYEPFRKALKD